MKSEPKYTRGTYNKPQRLTKRTHVNLTTVELFRLMQLKKRLNTTCTNVIRQALNELYVNKFVADDKDENVSVLPKGKKYTDMEIIHLAVMAEKNK